MKEIDDWLDETYLKLLSKRTKICVVVQTTFCKGMFFVMLMKFYLVVST